jgi:hypothetical protein
MLEHTVLENSTKREEALLGTEVARWFASGEVRQHHRELDTIWRAEEKAAAQIESIGRTTERAIMAGLCVTRTRNMAEQLAPDAADKLAMFDIASAAAIANVITDLTRRW